MKKIKSRKKFIIIVMIKLQKNLKKAENYSCYKKKLKSKKAEKIYYYRCEKKLKGQKQGSS